MRKLILLLSYLIIFSLSAQDNQTRWLAFHHADLNDFSQVNATKFHMEAQTAYDSVNEHVDLLKSFFIASPNGSKLIDIDSYGLLLVEENGKLVTYGGSSDTEVLLVDLQNYQQGRLAFYGTSVIVEDAFWLSDYIVRIFQIEVELNEFRLQFIEYDLARSTKTLWTSNITYSNYQNTYNEQVRLSSVTFK